MTTLTAALAAIRAKIETEWPHPDVPLVFDNEPYELPDVPAAFVRVEILPEAERVLAFGGGRGANEWRQEGRIEAHILVPIDRGTPAAAALSDAVAAIFRGQREGGISYFAAGALAAGARAENGNYWRMTRVIDFHFDLTG